MGIITFTIDEQQFSAQEEETVLDVARQHKLNIPTLCHLDGLSDIGACRLCLIEIEGSPKLMPACTTRRIPCVRRKPPVFGVRCEQPL